MKMLTYSTMQEMARLVQVALEPLCKDCGVNIRVYVNSTGFESTRASLIIDVESISPDEQFYNEMQDMVGNIMKKIGEKNYAQDKKERIKISDKITELWAKMARYDL